MQYKIGVYGSAVLENDAIVNKAHVLGKALSSYTVTLITGAGKGLPYQVVLEAKKLNNKIAIWGFPPVVDEKSLEAYTSDDISIYDKIVYIPQTFPFVQTVEACRAYRNAISTAHCDAGIVIAGRWGTLNEFTNLHEGGKIIGVLTGTGGIADELPTITKKINKASSAKVIFDNNPEELVNKILQELDNKYKNI